MTNILLLWKIYYVNKELIRMCKYYNNPTSVKR